MDRFVATHDGVVVQQLPLGDDRSADLTVVVGSGGGSHIRLIAPDVISVHALIQRAHGIYWVSDGGSVSGTRINGTLLQTGDTVQIYQGDQISIGPYAVACELPGLARPQDKPRTMELPAAYVGATSGGFQPADTSGVYAAPGSGGFAPAAPATSGEHAAATSGGYAPAASGGYAPATSGAHAPATSGGFAPATSGAHAPASPGQQPPTDPMDAWVRNMPPGSVVDGRYEVIAVQRFGVVETVYLARDRQVGRELALGVMLPSLLATGELAAWFQQAAQVARGLSHPGIAPVYEIGRDASTGLHYYTTEPVAGGTLRRWLDAAIEAGQPIDAHLATELACQVLEALSYAHEHTLHGTLTPETILVAPPLPGAPVGSPPRAVIVDFAIAQLELARHGVAESSGAAYLAPEQRAGGAATHAADVYSVAAVLYEMLTGETPSPISPRPSVRRPEIGAGLDEGVWRGLLADPRGRQQSAQAMLDELLPYAARSVMPVGGLGPSGTTVSLLKAVAPARSNLWLVAIGAVAATVVLGLGLFLTHGRLWGEAHAGAGEGASHVAGVHGPAGDMRGDESAPGAGAAVPDASHPLSASGNGGEGATGVPSSRAAAAARALEAEVAQSPHAARAADVDAQQGWNGEELPAGMRRGEAAPRYVWNTGYGVEIDMLYVPPGEVVLGAEGATSAPDQRPEQLVTLSYGFWIGRTEVTWGQYLAFSRRASHPVPPDPPWWIDQEHPVVNVSWEDARAFCRWAGVRLPRELEWEHAARGHDGRVWPWGTEEPGADRLSWFGRPGGGRETLPVDAFPEGASPFGVLGMAGNVSEWIADWYDPTAYERYSRGELAPPGRGLRRVVRGGGWDTPLVACRAAWRDARFPATISPALGFRVVKDAD
jgi:formylglycine-generating enzyme required for sulfatase activity